MRLREEALLPGQRGGLLPAMKAGRRPSPPEEGLLPASHPARPPPRRPGDPGGRGTRAPAGAERERGRERAHRPGSRVDWREALVPTFCTVSLFQIQSGRTATARGAGVVARRRSVNHTPHTFDSETPPDTRARIMVHACNLDGHNSYRSSRGLSNSRCHGAAATAHEVALRSERTPEKTRPSSVPGRSRSARG
jgi:hypothetical protein